MSVAVAFRVVEVTKISRYWTPHRQGISLDFQNPRTATTFRIAYDQAAEGNVHVITRCRNTNANRAEAVSEILLDTGNGTGRAISDSRRLIMERQHKSRRRETLSTNDRRAFSKSGAKTDVERAWQCDCDGLAHQETSRKSLTDNPGQLVTCGKVVSHQLEQNDDLPD